jgi:two-component system OmpR family sensor kinase
MLSRLSIRVRLTVLFAGVMTVVLLAIGGFVYERVATSLTASINKDLRVRADDVSGPKRDGAREDARDFGGAEGVAQLISANGRVLRGTPALETKPLLTPLEIQAARTGPIYLDRPAPLTFGDERWRLLAEPVTAAPEAEIAVVAASLKPREEALQHLLVQLLLAGAAALVLASIAGYAIAAAALRPVEEMSRRAAAISLTGGTTRLPVPPSGDEIAKLGMRLNEMLERLETAFAHERRFLADASHELQTPLAILRAELEIALRRPRSHEELEEVVRSAQEETNRLGRLAEDLLVVARADQGALPVNLTLIDADDLLSSVAERFERRAHESGRSITTETSPDLELICDPIRIGQALDNLIDNSLRYGAGSITLAARRRASVVELHVRDDGGGFPAAFLSRAFERFSRADGARSATGSGLGLAIVQAIAQAHGGDAAVANREEGGSDVWLALPASAL